MEIFGGRGFPYITPHSSVWWILFHEGLLNHLSSYLSLPPCFLNFKSLFQDDPQTASSRHFYISQWYRDSDAEIRKNSKKTKPRRKDKSEKSRQRGRRGRDSESETSEDEDDEDDDERQEEMPAMNAEVYRLTEARKEYLVSKICPFGPTSQRSTTLASHIDSTAACLIVK